MTSVSYWNDNGKFSKELSELTEKMMPDSGNAETLNGELVRAVNRLWYEYCNNGNCNARDTEFYYETHTESVWDEDLEDYIEEEYEEEVEGDTTITELYDNFLELIERTVPETEFNVSAIRNFICDSSRYGRIQFNQEYLDMYNELTDKVVMYVLNNEDKEIPNWYKG